MKDGVKPETASETKLKGNSLEKGRGRRMDGEVGNGVLKRRCRAIPNVRLIPFFVGFVGETFLLFHEAKICAALREATNCVVNGNHEPVGGGGFGKCVGSSRT